MGWILVFFLLACIFFVGCSFKTFLLYVIITGLSFGLTCLFVSNKWGLDGLFEEIFKAVELFGFGVPLRLESRIAYSPLYTDGGSETLEELPKPLEEELRKLMANIIRDFIRTWYEDVGKGDHFIAETQELIEILCIESYRRASQIDSHYLVEQVILIFHGHLERFNKAMAIVKAKDPKLRLSISSSQLLCQTYESQLKFERPALTSAAKELSYLRNVIDCLLAAMVPKDTFNCDTGRFILREILAVQVMSQLVQLLIDPDWICEAVIEVLTDRVSAKPQDFDVRNSSNDLGTGQFDGATNVDKQEVDDHLQRYDSVENTSSVKSIKTEEVLSQEREDSLDDVGDRIEITSPEICGDSPDCLPPWPVMSSRQPPIGESQHDNAESYLVISVEENRENSNAEQNQNGNSWSVEVVPPSSLESIGSSSLTSSWTCCPSSDDESFNEISFEEIKEKLSKAESYDNTGTALQGLKEMTCCYTSETNDKEYPSLSLVAQRGSSDEGSDVEDAPCTSLRTRSLSLPGTDEREVDSEQSLSSCIELTRSDSAPCTLSFTNIKKQDDEELYIHDSPRKAFGSPFYQTSFCSSSGSFKSISSDEDVVGSYIENSEEVLEDAFDIDPFTPQTQVKLSRSRMVKQASFDEPSDRVTSDSSVDELVVQKAILPTYNQDKEDSLDLSSNTEKSVLGNANEDNARGADKGDQRISGSVFEMQESEFSFGDVVLNAGKKFVSNFKPPFKFDSLSTSSTKSSEVSDRESMDCTADSQSRGYPQGMPVNTANTTAVMHATSDGMRRLSRSHAILEESMESDVGTCYGTPKEELERKKMHVDDVAQDCSSIEGIKRMHPSELISIPNTVVALETTWEPGRNKYTLYKIEYDIRIWHEVHSAAIKQARSDAKKERMKRRLYDDPMHNKEVDDDDEMSLEKIKRRVLLKRIINRRYREFMELHNRLTNGPLSVHMKDILRPNRKYNLPFGRLDPHVVEGRRKLLQYYLGSLISKPPLRNSEDLKQFLGVTEGKKISFIKPSVAQIVTQSVHVPRVDKMLSRQMTKVIDSIKTAFDSVEEGENLPDEPSLEGNDRTIVPWKLADQDTLKASPEADVNQGTDFSMHCFSAFLSDHVESSLPSSPSPLPGGKQEIFDEKDAGELWGKKNKVMPFDMNKEAGLWESYFKVSQHLGPRTAGDGSDNPDELSSTFPSNSPSFAQLAKTLGLHSDESKSEGSGAAFKRYLDVQSGYHEHQRPVQHLCVSQSLPRSKSMERISSEAMQGKFQFKPQKIFEAAKRIGQGNKSVSMESLEMASTEREKKRGALKKLFKEAPAKVFGRGPKKQKHVTEGMGDVPSPVGHPFDEEKPNALSAIDPPSSLDEMSFTNRASGGSDLQCPLSDAILSLLCELLKDHDSWLTINRVHQCFSATLGGLLEWCVQREIDNITSDDSWALYLNTLIEAIWPQGKLIEGVKKTKSEMEKARTRKEAVIALMDAFPGFVKLFIGPRAYQQIAVNVIECLQYPQLNKVMLYTILELVLSEFVPEIQESLPFFKGIGTQK